MPLSTVSHQPQQPQQPQQQADNQTVNSQSSSKSALSRARESVRFYQDANARRLQADTSFLTVRGSKQQSKSALISAFENLLVPPVLKPFQSALHWEMITSRKISREIITTVRDCLRRAAREIPADSTHFQYRFEGHLDDLRDWMLEDGREVNERKFFPIIKPLFVLVESDIFTKQAQTAVLDFLYGVISAAFAEVQDDSITNQFSHLNINHQHNSSENGDNHHAVDL